MENVTHSLIGVVLGEGIARARLKGRDPKEAESWRAGILWASVLGSNLPDFDFLLRPIAGGGNLGALLHHRGFTHTVLFSFPLALIAAGVGMLAARKSPVKPPWSLMWLAGWIGVLCHIGADFWNDYGVHPFWPWFNHWFYGDFIFIVEPLFWLGLLPFVYVITRSVWLRALCLVLGGGILGVVWFGHYMTWPVALWVSLWAAAWIAVHRRPRSVGYAFGTILLILVLFSVPGQVVRSRIKALLPPGESLVQLSTTPAPSNPLCWRVTVSSRTENPVGSPPVDYFARQGVIALHPFGIGEEGGFAPNDPHRCTPRRFAENSALRFEVEAPSLKQNDLVWAGEFRGNLKELNDAVATHCRLRALMRFVRMPFWMISPKGELTAGDLRYHSGKGLSFADVDSTPGEECLAHEPSWAAPSGVIDSIGQ